MAAPFSGCQRQPIAPGHIHSRQCKGGHGRVGRAGGGQLAADQFHFAGRPIPEGPGDSGAASASSWGMAAWCPGLTRPKVICPANFSQRFGRRQRAQGFVELPVQFGHPTLLRIVRARPDHSRVVRAGEEPMPRARHQQGRGGGHNRATHFSTAVTCSAGTSPRNFRVM